MLDFNLEQVGIEVTNLIKRQSWFPYKTGKLKFNATSGAMYDSQTFRIHFDSSVAPYVGYLEEGTDPHDIPNAFGFIHPGKKVRLKNGTFIYVSIPDFGIGGRFDGKFHPGSRKHQGFISQKAVGAIVDYIQSRYDGMVEVL